MYNQTNSQAVEFKAPNPIAGRLEDFQISKITKVKPMKCECGHFPKQSFEGHNKFKAVCQNTECNRESSLMTTMSLAFLSWNLLPTTENIPLERLYHPLYPNIRFLNQEKQKQLMQYELSLVGYTATPYELDFDSKSYALNRKLWADLVMKQFAPQAR